MSHPVPTPEAESDRSIDDGNRAAPSSAGAKVVSRRVVISTLVAVAGAAGGTWWYLQPVVVPARQEWVFTLLRAELYYLRMDTEGLERFAEQYVKWLDRQADAPTRRREDVVERYLLSTDFFPRADEAATVHFIALYDPYSFPCISLFGSKGG